ncbi:hypothetical protein BD289DRAFT_187022 [Coniella lustricola]|uniref:Uncharacterized protein n=1 Tax=Coniella lustricola TaxID=2025994 RepID=A0A2T3AD40_9PEZI|nr:hypothetical protein BD289DRAFT_187022 [Coniella lustricola]
MNVIRNVLWAAADAAKQVAECDAAKAVGAVTAVKGREFVEDACKVAGNATEWAKGHPGTIVGVSTGAMLVAAPMAAAVPVLAVVGFGIWGPVPGTIATCAQAGLGGTVAAGGLFATLQSAAMGGYGVATVAGAVQGLGAGVVAVTGGVSAWMDKKDSVSE